MGQVLKTTETNSYHIAINQLHLEQQKLRRIIIFLKNRVYSK